MMAIDRLNPHSAAVVLLLLTTIPLLSFARATPHLVSGECLPFERASLLHLKRGFSFDMDSSPTNLSSWKPGSNCCEWEGVTCDPDSGHVISLDLSGRDISGKLSGSLFNLTSLQTLDLSWNRFEGSFPQAGIENLTQLTHLDLFQAGFGGQVPIGISHLTNLTFLRIGAGDEIQFRSPSFRTLLGNLSNLRELQLERVDMSYDRDWSNALSTLMPRLQVLSLVSCGLSGSLPADINHIITSLFELPSLEELYLDHNNFNGTVNLDLFRNLKNLSYLTLSGLIVQEVSEKYFHVFPNLTLLTLASCGLTKVPTFLRYQNQIVYLDLSDNKIDGGIPNWIINQNLTRLNLSNNGFTHLEEPFNLSTPQLQFLDLHSNMLQGPIPLVFPSIQFLDYSNNNIAILSNISSYFNGIFALLIANNSLQGQIPMSICEAHNLQFLDFSLNNLSGPIPSCLFQNNNALNVLNLRGNRLQGTIPPHLNEACYLEALIISDNHLEGPLPRTLLNCTSLRVLDVGNNRIVDTFPFWLGNMINMNVLILRGNALYGQVETMESYEAHEKIFSEVRILDLSSNHFEGNLPSKCFNNLKFMMNSSNMDQVDKGNIETTYGGNYQVSITNTEDYTFERILTISYTFVDFSNNRFEGSIPEVIGKLQGLHKLNLSHNSLIGKIPPPIGSMTQLEQLDLSANHLSGEIPQELTSLNFLRILNLSNNNLIGRIPQGEQFNTFSNATYLENQGLCGNPLSKQCGNVNPNGTSASPSIISDHSSPSGYIIGLALFTGSGFGVGIATVFVLQNVQWKFWKRQNGAPV